MDIGRRYVESTLNGSDHACRAPRGLRPGLMSRYSPRSGPCWGLGRRRRRCSSAAAPLPPEVGAFFAGLGMRDLGHLRDDLEQDRRVHLQHRDRVPARDARAALRGHRVTTIAEKKRSSPAAR